VHGNVALREERRGQGLEGCLGLSNTVGAATVSVLERTENCWRLVMINKLVGFKIFLIFPVFPTGQFYQTREIRLVAVPYKPFDWETIINLRHRQLSNQYQDNKYNTQDGKQIREYHCPVFKILSSPFTTEFTKTTSSLHYIPNYPLHHSS
jgi:hypothetical protein